MQGGLFDTLTIYVRTVQRIEITQRNAPTRGAREDAVMTRDRDVIEQEVTRLVTPDGRDIFVQFDSRTGLRTRSDHQFVTVFTLWSPIRLRVHRVGRTNDGHRDGFG